MKSPTRKPAAAPPAYRPQPTPKVLQRKLATTPQTIAGQRAPVAPPVYRPQSAPRCLQLKTAASFNSLQKPAQPRPFSTPSKGTVQRFAWAIHDSRDMKRSAIVDENLRRAQSRYTHVETTTDPEKEEPKRILLNQGEAIHLHAHGNDEALSGFSADSLGRELQRKFDIEDLAGRTIVLHSCKTGQADFGKGLLEMLLAYATTADVNLAGTTVYAPVSFLVVEKDGFSYVAKDNVDESDLRTEQRQDKLRKAGDGWRGWTVTRHGTITETRGAGVLDAMDRQEGPKPEKYKPKKVKEKQKSYGYYDDPDRTLNDKEQALLSRALQQGYYPPRKRINNGSQL
jgi:hypothetical protein